MWHSNGIQSLHWIITLVLRHSDGKLIKGTKSHFPQLPKLTIKEFWPIVKNFSLTLNLKKKKEKNIIVWIKSNWRYEYKGDLTHKEEKRKKRGEEGRFRELQACVSGRSSRWQNQHHHLFHVRQLRHQLSDSTPIPSPSILIFQMNFFFVLFMMMMIPYEYWVSYA